MTKTLDFSTGKEPRIHVSVSGWSAHQKKVFAEKAQALATFTSVQGAGGGSSFYINFDPSEKSEAEVEKEIRRLVDEIGVLENKLPASIIRTPSNAATFDNTVVTFGSSEPTPDKSNSAEAPPVLTSSWTGISSLPERIIAVRQVAPLALAALETLIVQLELPGSNGGPPLLERQEAINALRALHEALGEVLAMAERPNFEWADGEGLFASCAQFAMRACETLKNDPIPFAVASLITGLFSVFGSAEAGALLGDFCLQFRKKTGH